MDILHLRLNCKVELGTDDRLLSIEMKYIVSSRSHPSYILIR